MVYVNLDTSGVYDFSGIDFQNAQIFSLDNVIYEDTFQVTGTDSDDAITGGVAVVNRLNGGDGNDLLTGGGADIDYLSGDFGNDTIRTGGGLNNFVFGDTSASATSAGDGTDTLALSGVFADYEIGSGSSLDKMVVTDLGAADLSRDPADGTAVLWGIEVLQFDGDGSRYYVPVISDGDGGANDTRAVSIEHGNLSVTTIAASDREDGTAVSYSIIDTTFAPLIASNFDLFSINSATGALSLNAEVAAGTYTVYVRVTDSDGLFDVQRITVSVERQNLPPAVGSAIATQSFAEDTAVFFSLAGDVIIDPEGDPLSWSATLADGSAIPSWLSFDSSTLTFSGTPAPNFNGNLSLKITASDTLGRSASQVFTLAITPVEDGPPVVVSDRFDLNPNATLQLTAADLLGNDNDPDGGPLRIEFDRVVNGSHSAAGLNAEGGITYTPLSSQDGQDRVDEIAYWVIDEAGNRTESRLFIHIVNEAPEAIDDQFEVAVGDVLQVSAPGYLQNDSDPEGGQLSGVLVTGSPGAVTPTVFLADGSFVYRPGEVVAAPVVWGQQRIDRIDYSVTDGWGGVSNTASIFVTVVNEAPDAVNDVYTVRIGQTLTIQSANGFLANDTDTEGHTLLGVVVANGGVTLGFVDSSGAFQITGANTAGEATFQYGVYDVYGASNSQFGTVTIRTVANTAPTAPATLIIEAGENGGAVSAAIGASDADGDSLTYAIKPGFTLQKGSVSIDSANVIYTPTEGMSGADQFVVVITDGFGGSAEQVVTVNIGPINDPITGFTLVNDLLPENSPEGTIVGTLSATDGDGNAVTFALSGPNAGLFVIDGNLIRVATGATIDYEAAGPDRALTVTVTATSEGEGIASTATSDFTIGIANVNEPLGPIPFVPSAWLKMLRQVPLSGGSRRI